MKNKIENRLEEITRYYGSLEAYNEEQRRCNLAAIEAAQRANTFAQAVRFYNPMPEEVVQARPAPRRLWLKLFGQKA